MTETLRLYREKMKAVSFIITRHHSDTRAGGYTHGVHTPEQVKVLTRVVSPQPPPTTGEWNELFITVRRCSGLQPRGSWQPSPYVVYKFFHFPDHPTATVHNRQDPDFHDLRSYSVSMDADLDRYLKSELLQFYVFDYKEEQMDTYLGKARVPLRTLTHDESLTGESGVCSTLFACRCSFSVQLQRDLLKWGSFSPSLPEHGHTHFTLVLNKLDRKCFHF